MRASNLTAIPLLALLIVVAAPAVAWYEIQLTDTPAASTRPRVVFDATGALHAIWEEGGEILECICTEGTWGPHQVIGAGGDYDFVFCSACNAIEIVWVGEDNCVHYRKWRNGTWYEPEILAWGAVGDIEEPRVTDAGGPCVVWVEVDGADATLFYSRRVLSWTPPEPLFGPSAGWWLSPTINTINLYDHILVTWLDDFAPAPGLYGRVWNQDEWEPAQLLFEGWGVRTDSDVVPGLFTVHFASNGLQPACPCNVVFYSRGTPGMWEEPESIGSGHTGGAWEWPREVSIAVAHTGFPYVVWRHETYDEEFNLTDDRLIFAENHGTWAFDYEIAANRNAHDPCVTANDEAEPAVAWSDDSDGDFDIYIATEHPLVGVPPSAPSPGRIALFPNPTRRAVTLAMDVPPAQRLWAKVFDLDGKLLATVASGRPTAGNERLSWDGRDDRGHDVPSGVYYVVVEADEARAGERLVIVR